MRNVALGDSIVRLLRYSGQNVISANYPGDEGAHVAKCLWFLTKNSLTPPLEGKGEWLGQVYVDAVSLLDKTKKTDPTTHKEYLREVSEVLQGIESKTGHFYIFGKKPGNGLLISLQRFIPGWELALTSIFMSRI